MEEELLPINTEVKLIKPISEKKWLIVAVVEEKKKNRIWYAILRKNNMGIEKRKVIDMLREHPTDETIQYMEIPEEYKEGYVLKWELRENMIINLTPEQDFWRRVNAKPTSS